MVYFILLIFVIISIIISIYCISKNFKEEKYSESNYNIYFVSHGTSFIMSKGNSINLINMTLPENLELCPNIVGYDYQKKINLNNRIDIEVPISQGKKYSFYIQNGNIHINNLQIYDTKNIIFNIENGQITPLFSDFICLK